MSISPQDRTTSGRTAGLSAGAGMSFVTTPTASAGTIGLAMFNTSPSLQTVPNGTAGYILVSSGPTTAPVWQPPTAVFTDDQTFASSPAGNVTMVFTPLAPSGTDGTINYTVQADVVRPVTISGSYNNTISGLVADNIQDAIDEIATLIAASALEIQNEGTSVEASTTKMDFTGNLVEATSSAAGEVIINIDSKTPGSYDNTVSGLAADNVQEAIDEVEGRLDIAETNITNLLAESHPAATVSATSNPALTIDTPTQVANLDLKTPGSYDNSTSNLAADNVQGAIDELAANPKGAFNGTSVDATTQKVQFGNDIGGTDATLQSDREIPMNNFNIHLERGTAAQNTVFQGDGTVIIGNNLVIKGDHDGATNAGNVIVRVGDDTAPIRENSVIQMATIHVPSGNIMTENKFQRSSDYTVLERLTKPFTHDVRGYKVDVPGSIINLLGSSSTGKYKLGQTAFNTGTAFSGENPLEVLPADAGNIKNLVFNTVTGDINLEGAVNAGYRKVEKIGTISLTAYPTTPTITSGGKHYYEIVETLTNTPSIPFLAPIGKKWMVRINGNILPQFVSPKNVNAETFSYLRINGIIAAESQDITPIVADTGATDASTVVAANRVDCVADVNQTVASTSAIEVMSYIRHDVAESITMPISNTGSDILGYWNLATELFLADL